MKIIAIIVLYNDNTEEAAYNIGMIAQQVDEVCLVDNSDNACPSRFVKIENATYLPQYSNKGIAAAQNVGIRYAIENKADFLLFADPDTTIERGAIDHLYNTYRKMENHNYNIGGIGSVARNRITHELYPLRSTFICEIEEMNVKQVTYTMNSISLYPTGLFQKVGFMDESLFIDGVDSEFCWRATDKTKACFYLDNNVIVDHQLGMGTKNVCGKAVSITPPFRMYYQYRNYLWLLKRPYTPKRWILENGVRYLIKMIYYPLFKSPRMQYVKYIAKGIYKGLFAQAL